MSHPPASSTLGADILLARHGNSIVAWRTDRHGERTRAKLKDGSWDSAPNTLVRTGEAPAARAVGKVNRWRRRHGEEVAGQAKFLGKVIAVWAVGSAVILGGLVAVLAHGVDPELLEQVMMAPGV